MKNDLVITITRIIFPFIVALGFYIQINGNNAPGGGFQAGVVMASAFILFCMVFGNDAANKVLSGTKLKMLAVLGVFLYGGTGLFCMVFGGEFLGYTALESSVFEKQTLGISIIEWGVGFTVFSVFSLIYYMLSTIGEKNIND